MEHVAPDKSVELTDPAQRGSPRKRGQSDERRNAKEDQSGRMLSCRVYRRFGWRPGDLWTANREHLSADWTLTLTDLSPGMIETAKGNATGLKLGTECRVADIQDLPFTDNQFDVVVANHMLYHVADLSHALGEVCRVMRKSGVLYCATNGINHMKELAELITGFAGKQVGQPLPELKFRTDNGGEVLSRFFLALCSRKAEFQNYLATELKRSGAIRIRKDVGLFAAYL